MTICDLCGREAELVDAIVEGALVNVCSNCSKFGKVISIKKNRVENNIKTTKLKEEELNELVVNDYYKKIKEAREKLGITQEQLAEKVKLKESTVQKLESGDLELDLILAKRLETFLKIKLVDTYKFEGNSKKINFSDKGLTIGDLLKGKL